MAEVWVADDLRLEREVAVKLISLQALRDGKEAVRARFEREAKAVAKIKNPHVVEILDTGVLDDSRPFIVMELLEGQTLGQRLKELRLLPLEEIVTIVVQVAKALRAAHKLGVVHRDVKPDNIFILHADDAEEDTLVKVVDFGIAKQHSGRQYGELTTDRMLLGTPEYMSPEQWDNPKSVDARSDLWALGVVTYKMITGRVPFRSAGIGGLVKQVSAGAYEPPSALVDALPMGIDEWFERVLCVDRDGRFGSASEMAKAFVTVVGGVPNAIDSRSEWGQPLASDPGLPVSGESDEVPQSADWTRVEWMVRTAGDETLLGPLTLRQIFTSLKTGEIPPDSELCRQGSTVWEFASVVLVRVAKPSTNPPPPNDQFETGQALAGAEHTIEDEATTPMQDDPDSATTSKLKKKQQRPPGQAVAVGPTSVEPSSKGNDLRRADEGNGSAPLSYPDPRRSERELVAGDSGDWPVPSVESVPPQGFGQPVTFGGASTTLSGLIPKARRTRWLVLAAVGALAVVAIVVFGLGSQSVVQSQQPTGTAREEGTNAATGPELSSMASSTGQRQQPADAGLDSARTPDQVTATPTVEPPKDPVAAAASAVKTPTSHKPGDVPKTNPPATSPTTTATVQSTATKPTASATKPDSDPNPFGRSRH